MMALSRTDGKPKITLSRTDGKPKITLSHTDGKPKNHGGGRGEPCYSS